MRRYNNTKSRSTLNRSKSTVSVRSAVQTLEYIDPATAERDAHIAATLSFSRARQNSVPDPGIKAWVSHHHSRLFDMENWPKDPANHRRPQSETTVHHEHDENGLYRQQSVRFNGHGSRSRRPQNHRDDNSIEMASIRRRRALEVFENQPRSQAAPQVEAPWVSTYTTNYIDSLPPVGSYRPADECAPAPASYRNLRKSRSMFTPSDLAPMTQNYYDRSPQQLSMQSGLRRDSMQNMEENKSPLKSLGLRAPKSTSFLKVRGVAGSARASNQQQNDLAVQEAEDSFRRDVQQQQQLKPRQSTFFSKKKQSQDSIGLRRSMRDSTKTGEFAHSTSSKTINKDASLRKKARKVSNSLKSKLKVLFRRNKKDNLHVAMDDRKEAHAVDYQTGVDSEQDDPYMDIIDTGLTDEASVSQVPSRVPSLHNVPSVQRLCSRQGSIESIGSERKISDEKSRVTSWTSSGTYTINSQSNWDGERDRQRLSVIKEIGPHLPSSSFRRPSIGGHNPYEFEPQSRYELGEPIRPVPPVDSARVYSALMGRLNETKLKERQSEQLRKRSNSPKSFENNSIENSCEYQDTKEAVGQSPPTIRCVLQSDDVFQDTPRALVPHITTEILATNPGKKEATSPSGSVIHHRQRSDSGTTIACCKPYPGPVSGDEHEDSPPMPLTKHGEDNTVSLKTLSHRSSAFFGSPTCHLFRTTSPYRRALQESMKEDIQTSTQLRSPTVSSLNLDMIPIRRRPSISQEDLRVAYSESLYSDDLLSPKINSESLSLNSQARPDVPWRHPNHRATDTDLHKACSRSVFSDVPTGRDIDTDTPVNNLRHEASNHRKIPLEPQMRMSTMPINRTVSNASSVEWKTWLSANVSRTDLNLANASAHEIAEDQYEKANVPKVLGHVREGAEVEDPEGSMSSKSTRPDRFKLATPLRIMSQNTRQASSASRVELGAKTSRFMISSRDENAVPSSDGRVSRQFRGVYDPPPIPPRSSLRTTPSMPLIQPRPLQSNIPTKFTDKASKMPSLDIMTSNKLAKVPSGTKTRSPVKLVRRAGPRRQLQLSASSPGLGMVMERQFGTQMDSEQSNRGSPKEKGASAHRLIDYSDPNSIDNFDASSLDEKRSRTPGSHPMVENFLKSSRQVTSNESTSGAFL